MRRLPVIRFLCLCLTLVGAIQFAVPMAGATDLPCHSTEAAMALNDMSAPCPASVPDCADKGCLNHAAALPVLPQRLPSAVNMSVRPVVLDVSLLRPLQMAGNLLRPPEA